MVLGPGEKTVVASSPASEPELRLLTELRPWHQVFFENLADTLLRRTTPHYWSRYPNADFWPDVFVQRGVTWSRMRQSGLAHVMALLVIYGFSTVWVSDHQRHPEVRIHPVIHYDLSEYLPPMDTGSPPAPKEQKGQPLLAKQKIISLQPNADNREQTIISPVDVKLPTNIPMPNIVAWTPTPGVPAALAARETSQLNIPRVPLDIIKPAPDPMQRDISKMNVAGANQKVIEPPPDARDLPNRQLDLEARVIEPPPSADLDKLARRSINAPMPSVIEPPPDANVTRNIGAMNIGHMQPTVAAPRIPVTEQRAEITLAPSTRSGRGAAGGADSGAVAPPISPVGGGMQGAANAGQLIALNLHPAIPNGPVSAPPGRRAGEFAAGPEGTKDAPGTPDIKGGGTGAGGSGKDVTGAGKGNGSLPAGITIGSAPGAPTGSAVIAGDPAHHVPNVNDAAKQVMLAGNRPPRVGELPRNDSHMPDAPKIEENRIFGDKKIYTLALNMPNLVSAGGSWIIRFAQLDDDHVAGQVSAPIAMTKVDPAYPAELIRGHVEGTVVLYAIIHKDGTVGEVRVIRGVQGRLDESARTALARWKFRPGTKNGQAVDLEAVVQIPFKSASRLPF